MLVILNTSNHSSVRGDVHGDVRGGVHGGVHDGVHRSKEACSSRRHGGRRDGDGRSVAGRRLSPLARAPPRLLALPHFRLKHHN